MADRPLGDIIDELQQVREEQRELSAQIKELNERINVLKADALEQMKRLGIAKASGELATVSVSEIEVPSVTDWTKLMRYIKRESAFHLFERRISKSAWGELVASRQGKAIPGVESFTKVDLNIRSL